MRKPQKNKAVVLYKKPKPNFLFKYGNGRILMPTPWKYLEPNYKTFKENIKYAKDFI